MMLYFIGKSPSKKGDLPTTISPNQTNRYCILISRQRTKDSSIIKPKCIKVTKTDKFQTSEFQNEDDLDRLVDSPDELVLQSVFVMERVLGVTHQYTLNHIKEWFVYLRSTPD
jgi:hypothetical protein